MAGEKSGQCRRKTEIVYTEQKPLKETKMLDRDKSFWVIESYFLGKLHYWSGGAKGRSYENGWSLTIDFATKFFDRESADGVMVKLCDGVGRSVEHGMLSLEPLK